MVMLKSAQFMSAEDKLKVLKAWERFLKNGCRRDYFTDALYKHLTLNCSFIAHNDRAGFYETYFVRGEDTDHFFRQFDNSNGIPHSIEYGEIMWYTDPRYNDINAEMCRIAASYIPVLVGRARTEQRAADIDLARRLLAKHGIKLNV